MKLSLRKLCSILFILAAVIFFSLSAYRRYKVRKVIDSTLASEHWQERFKEFKSQPRTTGRVIFLGNSLTELFDLGILGDSTIINRGITGDFTEGVLKRLDEVTSLKPSKLFLEIGINDLVEHVSIKEVTKNYRLIVKEIRKRSPATKIYFQSLLPVNMISTLVTSTQDVNEEVKEQNKALKELAKEQQVTFIDLYDNYVIDGGLNPRLTWDGIHLVDEGYTIWKNLLIPYLK